MARRRVVLKDPGALQGPGQPGRYIRLSKAGERERYPAGRDTLPPEAPDFRGVKPGYPPRHGVGRSLRDPEYGG